MKNDMLVIVVVGICFMSAVMFDLYWRSEANRLTGRCVEIEREFKEFKRSIPKVVFDYYGPDNE